jgi:hypothetical protein
MRLRDAVIKLGAKLPHPLLLACCLIGLVIRLIIVWQPVDEVVHRVFIDDSFYYLNIARHIALGNGPTHDGINPTNGFQPLWVFLIVPIFWAIQDKLTAVKVVATLCALLSTITALPIYGISRHLISERVGLLNAFLWLFSPSVLRHSLNGMETGLYVFLVAITVWWYLYSIKIERAETFNQWGNLFASRVYRFVIVGVLLGLTVLARIDGILLLVAIAADMWMAPYRRKILNEVFVMFMPIVALIMGWLFFSLCTTGDLFPVSGKAKQFWAFLSDGGNFMMSFKEGLKEIIHFRQLVFIYSKLMHILEPQLIWILISMLCALVCLGMFKSMSEILILLRQLKF